MSLSLDRGRSREIATDTQCAACVPYSLESVNHARLFTIFEEIMSQLIGTRVRTSTDIVRASSLRSSSSSSLVSHSSRRSLPPLEAPMRLGSSFRSVSRLGRDTLRSVRSRRISISHGSFATTRPTSLPSLAKSSATTSVSACWTLSRASSGSATRMWPPAAAPSISA
jgi:hypothetical protein